VRSPAAIHEASTEAEVEALMQEDAGAVVIEVATRRTSASRVVGRVLQSVAKAHAGPPVAFATVRADLQPALAQRFEVRSLPTILFVLDGEIVDAMVGRIEAASLAKRVGWLARRAEGVGFFARLLRRRA
jgi:thioredoxin 1